MGWVAIYTFGTGSGVGGGSPGRPGRDGRSLLTGVGPPAFDLGTEGDSYLDQHLYSLWSKRTLFEFVPPIWMEIGNLAGPGPPGPPGPMGERGPCGPVGPRGPAATLVASGAEVQRSTNQAIPTATDTVVTFPTTVRDDGSFTSGSPVDRLVAPEGGWYMMTATIRWASTAGGFRALWFLQNGGFTNGPVGQTGNATTVGDVGLMASYLTYMQAASYMQVNAYQDTGGDLNITGANFSMALLG